MKVLFTLICLISVTFCYAQIDMEKLALDVSKADAANTEKLKAFIWKRHSTATVKGEVKATVINEVSFNEKGEIQVTQVGGESNVKQKRGIRGRVQQNAIEDNTEYVGKALQMAIAYTYMSKGHLIDFFDKATITDYGDKYQIIGQNVLVEGDKLTVIVEKATNLFLSKKFSSLLGEDPLDAEIQYGKFSSGISHATETVMNLPAKEAVINAVNQDYSQRIN